MPIYAEIYENVNLSLRYTIDRLHTAYGSEGVEKFESRRENSEQAPIQD